MPDRVNAQNNPLLLGRVTSGPADSSQANERPGIVMAKYNTLELLVWDKPLRNGQRVGKLYKVERKHAAYTWRGYVTLTQG